MSKYYDDYSDDNDEIDYYEKNYDDYDGVDYSEDIDDSLSDFLDKPEFEEYDWNSYCRDFSRQLEIEKMEKKLFDLQEECMDRFFDRICCGSCSRCDIQKSISYYECEIEENGR